MNTKSHVPVITERNARSSEAQRDLIRSAPSVPLLLSADARSLAGFPAVRNRLPADY